MSKQVGHPMMHQKLHINRDKMRDSNIPNDQVTQHWQTIRDAIFKIYNKEASQLSYEELYRTAYMLVLHKHGEMLYTNVKNTTAELLKPIAAKILSAHDDEFLEELNTVWIEKKLCIIMIKDILLYMDKNYVPKMKLQSVEHMQTSQFKHHIILNHQIKSRLITRLIDEIRSERNGDIIEKGQIASAVQMLIEVGMQSKKIYESEFESQFIIETKNYYQAESNRKITEYSCDAYLNQACKRLNEERERLANYLHPSTEQKLTDAFLCQYLGEQQAQTLLAMENSGLVHMIKNEKIDQLSMLYSMFSITPSAFTHLRNHFSAYIIEEGKKLVDDEKLKNEDLCCKLINLRQRIIDIYTKCMNKDNQIDLTIKMSFEKFINSTNRTAKALVFYLDEMFKTEFVQMNEVEMQDKVDKVIQVFRYIQDKDIFEGFYKNSFSKRLLESRHVCEDAERMLIVKLKEECGFQFTQRLEVMFKDIKMSEEIMSEYRHTNLFRNQPIEMNVKVLTAGIWTEGPSHEFLLPKEIKSAMSDFQMFYLNKFNKGRQINWKLSMGSAEIKAQFANTYQLITSSYQMSIILIFNESYSITWQKLKQITQIPDRDLKCNLIPLIQLKLISKNPSIKEFNPDDELTINPNFRHNQIRINVPVLQSKQNKDQEKTKIQAKVGDDRRFIVDCTIVKVMKSKRIIDYTSLITETTKLLQMKFSPDPVMLKARIEALIEQEYIERDPNDRRTLRYKA